MTTASGTVTTTVNAEGVFMALSSATATIQTSVITRTAAVQGWHFPWQPTSECPKP